MTNRCTGCVLAGSTLLLLLAVTWTNAQTQKGKEPQLPPMPKDFDARRDNIDRGKIETLEYESKTVGAKRKLVVYLPPGFAKDKKYPVFYLLHGLGGNETNWSKQGLAANILDNLYADKKVVPMIVVMPNGMVEVGDIGKGGQGKAAKGKGKGGDYINGFEPELLKDVVPFAEARYPIQADADHRALAGLSMGGGQSLRIGVKHLDKFAWIGGFSSAYLQGKANLFPNADDANKKLKLLYVACGDADTLFNSNKSLIASLEKSKVQHVWNVVPGGAHNFVVWKNDLYLFSQMIFQDKK